MKKITKILSLVFVLLLSFIGIAGAQTNARVRLDTDVKVESSGAKLDTDIESDTSVNKERRGGDDDINDEDEGKDKDEDENEDEDSSTKDDSDSDDNEDKGETRSLEHRSAVATYVKGLLDISLKDRGIGEEVKVIAKSQNDDSEKSEDAVKKVSSRGKFRTFLFGSDYKNLGLLRSLMAKTDNDIKQLTALIEKAQTPETKAELEAQITLMKSEQAKIATFIKTFEGKFSLFGWLRSK